MITHLRKKEGRITKGIERRTSRLPSDTFLIAAGASMLLSFILLRKERKEAAFVGMWAPTFLILGLYNKLVKLFGSE